MLAKWLKGTMETKNKKILKSLIFYDKICATMPEAAMVAAAVCNNMNSVTFVMQESSILQ